MPTAGRLAGAVTFMILAIAVSAMMVPLYPDGLVPRHFYEINVAVALIAGWVTVGSRTGQGYVAAFGVGVTGLAVFLFWMFFLHGFDENSLERQQHRRRPAAAAKTHCSGGVLDQTPVSCARAAQRPTGRTENGDDILLPIRIAGAKRRAGFFLVQCKPAAIIAAVRETPQYRRNTHDRTD